MKLLTIELSKLVLPQFLVALILSFTFPNLAISQNTAPSPTVRIKAVELGPNNKINNIKYNPVKISIRDELKEIISSEKFHLLPDLDVIYERNLEETAADIELWVKLNIPQPYIESNYQLSIKTIIYHDSLPAQEKSINLDLGKEIRAIRKVIKSQKEKIINLISERPSGDLLRSEIDEHWAERMFDFHETFVTEFHIEDSTFIKIHFPYQIKTFEEDGFSVAADSSYSKFKIVYPINDSALIYRQQLIDQYPEYIASDKLFKLQLDYFNSTKEEITEIPHINNVPIELESVFFGRKFNIGRKYHASRGAKNAFNILVFPFDAANTCEDDLSPFCTKAIRNRMISKGLEEGLALYVNVNKKFNTPNHPLSYADAKRIGDFCQADLLVWGDYEYKKQWDSTLINVKYLPMDTKTVDPIIKGSRQTGILKVDAISSLGHPTYIQDIDDIVYYSLGKATKDCALKTKLYNRLSIDKTSAGYGLILYDLGVCYWPSNSKDSTLSFFSKAYELDSTNVKILSGLAALHKELNQYETALSYHEKQLKYNPQAHSVYAVAETHVKAGQPELALQVIQKHFKAEGYTAYSLNYCAALYQRIGDYESALNNINKAIYLDKDYNALYLRKIDILHALKAHDQVPETLEAAAAIIDCTNDCYNEKKDLLQKKIHHFLHFEKDTSTAKIVYDSLVNLPIHPFRKIETHELRYRFANRIEDKELAKIDLDSLCFYESQKSKHRYNRCRVFFELGDSIAALKDLEYLIANFPENKNYVLDLGYFHLFEKNFKRAKSLFNSVRYDVKLEQQALKALIYLNAHPENRNENEIRRIIEELHRIKLAAIKKGQEYLVPSFTIALFNFSHPIFSVNSFDTGTKHIIELFENEMYSLFPDKDEKTYKKAWNGLAQLNVSRLKSQNRYEEAIEFINSIQTDTSIYKIDVNQQETWFYNLANLYFKINDAENTIKAMDNLLYQKLNTPEKREKNGKMVEQIKTYYYLKPFIELESFKQLETKYQNYLNSFKKKKKK